MENAAKALLISGGVLIAVLLLTLFSYLFGKMSEGTSKAYDDMEKHEISEFNQQFLNYEGRNDLTVQDVATLINLAIDSEKNSKFRAKVEIKYGGNNIASNSQEAKNWLSNTAKSSKKYKCKSIKISKTTLLVYEVNIVDN